MSRIDADSPFDDKTVEVEMVQNQYHKAMQAQFVGQWITSLAISVVCCAVLFVVFSGYMVRLHEKANLAEIRIESLQEKYNQISAEVIAIRRSPGSTVFNLQGVAPAAPASAAPQAAAPLELGVKIEDENAAPAPVAEPAPVTTAPPSEEMSKKKIDLGVPAFEPSKNNTPIVR